MNSRISQPRGGEEVDERFDDRVGRCARRALDGRLARQQRGQIPSSISAASACRRRATDLVGQEERQGPGDEHPTR